MNRRSFLNRLSLAAASMVLLPSYSNRVSNKKNVILKAGICADVHRDLVPDNEWRLQSFINSMNERGDIDFIIQLGDFCRLYERNIPFMNMWHSFHGPAYHVIGNHEFDDGFTQEQIIAYYGLKETYYSFDNNDYHFVILSGNDIKPTDPKYLIGEEQRRWLADDLDKTNKPVIAFCHQSLDENLEDIGNAGLTRSIFERANEKAGFRKVRLIYSGHNHADFHSIINGIHYVTINSMAYQWFGEPHDCNWYTEEIKQKYRRVNHFIPYKDPLWAVMTIYADGEIDIEGRSSEFLCPLTDEQRYVVNGMDIYVPFISNRRLI